MIRGARMAPGTRSSSTKIEISGTLSTISIRLPTIMLAMTPKKMSGRFAIRVGPGVMPCTSSAPRITPITALAGMPSDSSGTNEDCAAALLADSGPGDALDRAVAEALGVLREPPFQHVGGERRQRRAAAGQQAEEESEARAAQDRQDARRASPRARAAARTACSAARPSAPSRRRPPPSPAVRRRRRCPSPAARCSSRRTA